MDMFDMMDMIGMTIPRIPSKAELSRLDSIRAEITARGLKITLMTVASFAGKGAPFSVTQPVRKSTT